MFIAQFIVQISIYLFLRHIKFSLLAACNRRDQDYSISLFQFRFWPLEKINISAVNKDPDFRIFIFEGLSDCSFEVGSKTGFQDLEQGLYRVSRVDFKPDLMLACNYTD